MSRVRKVPLEEYEAIAAAFSQRYTPNPTKREVYQEIADVFEVHWKIIERIVNEQSRLK